MGAAYGFDVVGVLSRRALNEILRVPGAAIPGIMAPTIFFLGLTAVFGNLTQLGYPTDSFQSWIIPVSMMQAAGFTGAATGVNLARDIELGWFDRLLTAPVPRVTLLAGLVASASIRCLLPVTFLLIVGVALGAHFPGIDGLLVGIVIIMGMAIVAACWGCGIALRFKTQSAAPLMQAAMLLLILTTTAYAPQELLTGWLAVVAEVNPVTQTVEAVRQGFIGDVTWGDTLPGLLTVIGLAALFGALALRNLAHFTDE